MFFYLFVRFTVGNSGNRMGFLNIYFLCVYICNGYRIYGVFEGYYEKTPFIHYISPKTGYCNYILINPYNNAACTVHQSKWCRDPAAASAVFFICKSPHSLEGQSQHLKRCRAAASNNSGMLKTRIITFCNISRNQYFQTISLSWH